MAAILQAAVGLQAATAIRVIIPAIQMRLDIMVVGLLQNEPVKEAEGYLSFSLATGDIKNA